MGIYTGCSNSIKRYTVRTKFGEWMAMRLCSTGMTIQDVADRLHCSRQIVSMHLNGTAKPSFRDVVAYCWVFNSKDDPECVWNMTKEEL